MKRDAEMHLSFYFLMWTQTNGRRKINIDILIFVCYHFLEAIIRGYGK